MAPISKPTRHKSKATSTKLELNPTSKLQAIPAPDPVVTSNTTISTVEFAATTFPSLSMIGNAFTQAISSINSQKNIDLDAEAQKWLTRTGKQIMKRLKSELQQLHVHKSNLVLLPTYALNPQASLQIYAEVPYALAPYRSQFQDYLRQLLEACGFDTEIDYFPFEGREDISIEIMFPEISRAMRAKASGNLTSNIDFQDEFLSAVKDLRIGN